MLKESSSIEISDRLLLMDLRVVFNNAGWMVRFLVDVEWNVSWFVVWQFQVKCDVKKVSYFLIGLDM